MIYRHGKIYKIVNSVNNKVYIGSTTDSLDQRFWVHQAYAERKPKRRLYQEMNRLGHNKFRIVLIKNFPCSSHKALQQEERKYFLKYKPELNTNYPLALNNKTKVKIY